MWGKPLQVDLSGNFYIFGPSLREGGLRQVAGALLMFLPVVELSSGWLGPLPPGPPDWWRLRQILDFCSEEIQPQQRKHVITRTRGCSNSEVINPSRYHRGNKELEAKLIFTFSKYLWFKPILKTGEGREELEWTFKGRWEVTFAVVSVTEVMIFNITVFVVKTRKYGAYRIWSDFYNGTHSWWQALPVSLSVGLNFYCHVNDFLFLVSVVYKNS